MKHTGDSMIVETYVFKSSPYYPGTVQHTYRFSLGRTAIYALKMDQSANGERRYDKEDKAPDRQEKTCRNQANESATV